MIQSLGLKKYMLGVHWPHMFSLTMSERQMHTISGAMESCGGQSARCMITRQLWAHNVKSIWSPILSGKFSAFFLCLVLDFRGSIVNLFQYNPFLHGSVNSVRVLK